MPNFPRIRPSLSSLLSPTMPGDEWAQRREEMAMDIAQKILDLQPGELISVERVEDNEAHQFTVTFRTKREETT